MAGEDDNHNDRNSRLEGWDPLKVKNANVTIVGSGSLANYLCTYIAGLGLGKVRLVSNEMLDVMNINEFLINDQEQGKPKVEHLAQEIKRLNPEIEVIAKNVYVDKQDVGLNSVEFLVDVTNNPDSKRRCMQIADELKNEGKRIKYFLSASTSRTKGSVAIYTPVAYDPLLDSQRTDAQKSYTDTDSIIDLMISSARQNISTALKQSGDYLESVIAERTRPMSRKRKHESSRLGIEEDILCSVSSIEQGDVVYATFSKQKTRERKKYDMQSAETFLMHEYADEGQGNVTSGVIAAIILDEIRKAVIPRACEVQEDTQDDIYIKFTQPNEGNGKTIKILRNRFDYNLLSNERFFPEDNIPVASGYTRDELKTKSVLVVGGGGIGTYALLNLALMGVGDIYIIEPDKIEGSNYNRQFLYVGHTGELKAEVMKEQLERINPQVKVHAIADLVKEGTLDNVIGAGKVDLILGCVDNWEARVHMNDFAVKNKIPYIDGSLDPFTGRVSFYSPGKSPCLDCQSSYKAKVESGKEREKEKYDEVVKLLRKDAETNERLHQLIQTEKGLALAVRETQVCRNRAGSIVVSNALVGTLMAAEALTYIIPHKFSNPLQGKEITYSSNLEGRLEVREADKCACDRVEEQQRCNCHQKPLYEI